jgi:hypothetical protein
MNSNILKRFCAVSFALFVWADASLLLTAVRDLKTAMAATLKYIATNCHCIWWRRSYVRVVSN